MTLESKLLMWLINGEVGISSKAIATVMAGFPVNESKYTNSIPHDPSDFKRCLKLIRDIPEIRPRLHEMSSVSDSWKRIVDGWDEIEKSFMEEVPEWLDDGGRTKFAPKTLKLMRKIISG